MTDPGPDGLRDEDAIGWVDHEGEGERRYIAWQKWHDANCAQSHQHDAPWDFRGPNVVTVYADPYL